MKPPGGNYKPNRININKIPASSAERDRADASGVSRGESRGESHGDNGGNGVGAAAGVELHGGGGYATAKVMSATPLELILIMFEQFFELIPDIKESIRRRSAAAMEPDSERAQAIIDELLNALDLDVEMSLDLGAIYYYVRNKILEANVRFDASIWDHIESLMRPLYEGFKDAERQTDTYGRQSAIPTANPAIVAGITYGQGRLKEIVVNTKSGLRA